MPGQRLPMRQVREVLRLTHVCGHSGHRIAAMVGDEDALSAAFALPIPPGPLGTMPAVAVGPLCVAIRRVRTQRSLSYDWAAMAPLAEDDPEAFELLVTDERCQVLDLLLV